MTRPKAVQNQAEQRARAYQILGVTEEDVRKAPQIRYWIKSIEGGKTAALLYLRGSPLPEARAFCEVYDNPQYPDFMRSLLPIEAFCVKAKIDPPRLMGVITDSLQFYSVQMGAIKAAQKHEEIVGLNNDRALDPKGRTDRALHLKHMGFLPQPKGSQININMVANAQAKAESDMKPLAVSVPRAEDTIKRMVGRFQSNRQALPAAEVVEVKPLDPLLVRAGEQEEVWDQEG